LPKYKNIEDQKAKITYHTEERDLLHKLAQKYKCSPFTGDCYTQEVSLNKIKNLYHIILTEEQINQFGEDFIIEEDRGVGTHRSLLMIKPTSEDNNYIFFRRK
jgi:hypothetical protein